MKNNPMMYQAYTLGFLVRRPVDVEGCPPLSGTDRRRVICFSPFMGQPG